MLLFFKKGRCLKLTKEINYTNIKRFMLSCAVKRIENLSPMEINQSARAVLKFCHIITEKQIASTLAQACVKKEADFPLTESVLEFIGGDQGSPVINTNLCSSLLTNVMLPFSHISEVFKNPKLVFPKHEKIPIRCAIEMPAANRHLETFNSFIKEMRLMGDKTAVPYRTNNPNRDLIIEYLSGSVKDKDFKSGKIYLNSTQGGKLKHVTVCDDLLVSYPNDTCTKSFLINYYTKFLNTARSAILLENLKLANSKQEFKFYQETLSEIQNILQSNDDILKKAPLIEQQIIMLDNLSNNTPNMDYLEIYHVSNRQLTNEEMIFLNRLIDQMDPNYLLKEKHMRDFIIDALTIYNEVVNPKAFCAINYFANHPDFSWLKRGLGLAENFFL